MEFGLEYQYMVDFSLPEVLTEEFMNLIPYQRNIINKLFLEKTLVSYALSLENGKLWAIFNGNSEIEIMDIISELPLTRMMSAEISILTFHNVNAPKMPDFSLN